MDNIASTLQRSTALLRATSSSAALDSQVLLAYVIDKPTSYLLTWPEQVLTKNQHFQFQQLIAERVKGMPIAYLVGKQEFWSLTLEVSPATLIPRADTELLVEQVLQLFDAAPLNCLDLGTGTGAIALALASERSEWHIDAVDFQLPAVELAQRNQQRHGINNVHVFYSDWFSAIPADHRYQLIVSNPPYINVDDPHLVIGDVRFEPSTALVAEQHGLADIQLIATQARRYLTSTGMLMVEHGYQQKQAVQQLLQQLGYQQICTKQDLAGHDRITFACY